MGIWRPVELGRERRVAVRGVHFYTLEIDREGDRAAVAARVEVERLVTEEPLSATITLARDGRTVAENRFAVDGDGSQLAATAYLTVDNPGSWWTHDLGEPALYDLRVVLEQGGEELAEHR